jgi:DNA repair protein RecN (Recombination protein N)
MKNKKTHYLELKSLILQNFATFSNQEVHFTSGLNAIIGETGSGKSLLMEALAMVLGERADKKVVRSGHDFASVEARFVTEGLETKKFLDDLGYPIDGDEVVIKRLIYTEGKSKSFLNLNQCSLQTLQEFTREFIDLVGQFENQRLLSSTYQLELLDEFAQHTPQVATYAGMFKEYAALKAKKNALLEQEKFRLQQIDFLKFQVQEINDLSPSVKEEERLSELKRSVVNNDLQEKTVSYIQQCLDGNDERQGLLTLASQIHHSVIKIRNFLPQSIIQKFDDFFALAKDFEQDIKNFRIHSLSEEEIATVIDNLDKYQKLKRKHGGTIPQILEQQ